MIFLPDTNVWIRYLNAGNNTPVKSRICQLTLSELRLCSVVKSELWYGAYRSQRKDQNLKLINILFYKFNSLAFDDAAANVCAQIRADLAVKGTPIGPNDLMIASIALTNNFTLVTHNTREFSRVDRLMIEDWETST